MSTLEWLVMGFRWEQRKAGRLRAAEAAAFCALYPPRTGCTGGWIGHCPTRRQHPHVYFSYPSLRDHTIESYPLRTVRG